VRKRLDFEWPVSNDVIRVCLELALQAPTAAAKRNGVGSWLPIVTRATPWVIFIAGAPGHIWRMANGTLMQLEPHKTLARFRRPDI